MDELEFNFFLMMQHLQSTHPNYGMLMINNTKGTNNNITSPRTNFTFLFKNKQTNNKKTQKTNKQTKPV